MSALNLWVDALLLFELSPKTVDAVYSQNAPSDYQMSERIVASNLDEVMKKNKEIHADMIQKVLVIRTNWNKMQISSTNLLPYYTELPEMDFLSKIFHCMDTFQAPYKAVLIALYESAVQHKK